MSLYVTKTPGDVLILEDDCFLDILPGHWVLWAVEDDDVYLSRMGTNEDGDFCTTHAIIMIGLAELSFFQQTELTLRLLD
jgi:hypothetical protein